MRRVKRDLGGGVGVGGETGQRGVAVVFVWMRPDIAPGGRLAAEIDCGAVVCEFTRRELSATLSCVTSCV